jgi:hypothetical protein
MSADATRAKAVGLLIIAALILLISVIRWGGAIPWSAR